MVIFFYFIGGFLYRRWDNVVSFCDGLKYMIFINIIVKEI